MILTFQMLSLLTYLLTWLEGFFSLLSFWEYTVWHYVIGLLLLFFNTAALPLKKTMNLL